MSNIGSALPPLGSSGFFSRSKMWRQVDFLRKMSHELRKKRKKYKNSSRKYPFSDSLWEVLHASLEKRNGSLRRFLDENVRSWPDSVAKPVLEAPWKAVRGKLTCDHAVVIFRARKGPFVCNFKSAASLLKVIIRYLFLGIYNIQRYMTMYLYMLCITLSTKIGLQKCCHVWKLCANTFLSISVWVSMYICTSIYIHKHTHTYTHTHTHTVAHIYIHTFMCTYKYTYICIYIHVYVYICILYRYIENDIFDPIIQYLESVSIRLCWLALLLRRHYGRRLSHGHLQWNLHSQHSPCTWEHVGKREVWADVITSLEYLQKERLPATGVRVRPWHWYVWCSGLREYHTDARFYVVSPKCDLYLDMYIGVSCTGLYVKLEVLWEVHFPLALYLDRVCVCIVLLNRYWGIINVPGFHHERAKGDAPTIQDRRHPSSPCPPIDNLGCPDPHPPPLLRRWLYRSQFKHICHMNKTIHTLTTITIIIELSGRGAGR